MLAREKSLERQPKTELQHREETLKQQQAGAREGPDSGAGGGRERPGAFLGLYVRIENWQTKADRGYIRREGSLMQGRIHSRPQELGQEWGNLEEKGCRTEMRRAIGALQSE